VDYRGAIIRELRGILEHSSHRLDHIKAFQRLIWEHEDLGLSPSEYDLFRDLAIDLDYYRPEDSCDDPAYYDDERLKSEVHSVLMRVQAKE